MSDPMSSIPYDFDPAAQLLNYTSVYGPAQLTFNDIQGYVNENIQTSIIYGCVIGAGGLMSLILWLISKHKKTPIFILNQLSLLFLVVHAGLYTSYLSGPFNSATATFVGVQSDSGSAKVVTIATNIVQVLLITCIEGSLAFQVKIIFRSSDVYRLGLAVTATASACGLATIGCYLAACIKSIMSLYSNVPLSQVLVNLPIILFAASAVLICLILMAKLGLAIRSRRYLGLKQFDTLHILIIMVAQTMIIPAILVILSFSYVTTVSYRLTPISTMLVTLQLPLSSMWAASANNNSEPSSTAGSYISRTSSRTSSPTLITSNGSTYYGEQTSHDFEKQSQFDQEVFVLHPRHRGQRETTAASGLDSYELDEEDRYLWEEAQRLTELNQEGKDNESADFTSTVVHKINSSVERR